MRALRIENDLLAATVLVDKGADIYELIFKPLDLDVLWKSPWGLKEQGRGVHSAANSVEAWLENYAGGWQEIFPSGGGPCTYKGVDLNYHGEASTIVWEHRITESGGDAAEVVLSARLYRSPFRIERTMRVEAGQPLLIIKERITNEGGAPMDYMWGHHPAYGAPFVSEACRIDVGARVLRADNAYPGSDNPLELGKLYEWPLAVKDGVQTDMSLVPGPDSSRDILAYFEEFESGWYGITNTEFGFGVGLVWPVEDFPFAWFWQEMNASPGYPWYKGAYVMAIEPFSSYPGYGLTTVMEQTGTHRTLQAGESTETEIRAVFYDSTTGIRRIESDGTVQVR
ncbi:MAG: DUF4432 family protein [Chloroflexi bacterium]|nr:DUF4432 family protein [Chloroflexota bacterium]